MACIADSLEGVERTKSQKGSQSLSSNSTAERPRTRDKVVLIFHDYIYVLVILPATVQTFVALQVTQSDN